MFEAMLLPTIRRDFTPRPKQLGFRNTPPPSSYREYCTTSPPSLTRKRWRLRYSSTWRKLLTGWHAGLVYRLLDSDIPRRVMTIIRFFLLDWRFHVSAEGVKSSCRPVAAWAVAYRRACTQSIRSWVCGVTVCGRHRLHRNVTQRAPRSCQAAEVAGRPSRLAGTAALERQCRQAPGHSNYYYP
ncbi:unnamed protein product [Pieris brassicae]|uniref:Uncharacterized protein n=1 Tax=Pieris brassicae TaxID=7116 RepID=A0A9P0XB21_PIEBR|nr:unnamed protein product [Pieris brassicae]